MKIANCSVHKSEMHTGLNKRRKCEKVYGYKINTGLWKALGEEGNSEESCTQTMRHGLTLV